MNLTWRWRIAVMVCVVLFVLGFKAAYGQTTRIDTFDKQSRRTGYLLVDPATGRVDQFGKYSNRKGYGRITSPGLPSPGPGRAPLSGSRPSSLSK